MNKRDFSFSEGASNCPLSDKDEELLLSFLDGETGFWSSRRARRLLGASSVARQFVQSILTLKERVGEWSEMSSAQQAKIDLWDRIDRRISQEEHAALFLGGREFAQRLYESKQQGSWFERVLAPGAWGTAGALVAASLTVFLLQPNDPIASPKLMSEAVSDVQNVAFEPTNVSEFYSPSSQRGIDRQLYRRAKLRESARADGSGVSPRILPSELNQLTQVDWMRSDGQLLFVQAPRPGSTIIWVKRPAAAKTAQRDPAQGKRPVILDREQDILPRETPVFR